MSQLRGFVYWLVASSPLSRGLGRMLRSRPFDRMGLISVPEGISPETVTGIAFGAYEYSEKYLIRRWLPNDLDVVELGASIGIVSREILRLISPDKRLIAVEALPALTNLAKRNIARRYPKRHWQLIQGAVAYGPEHLASFATGANHTAGSLRADSGDSLKLKTTRLADVLEKFHVRDFSLVMDIEGAEHEVLRYDQRSFARCQCVIVELHGEETEKRFFCQTLQEMGMKCVETKHSVAAFIRT